MPLVRFSLMETQFFRQDSFTNFFILTFCFRRVVKPNVGPEMEEEVERLFYTPTPARFSLLLLTYLIFFQSGLPTLSSLPLGDGSALVQGTLPPLDLPLTS